MVQIRDPKRIPKVLEKIERLWSKFPDLRLGQLILNVFSLHNGIYVAVYNMEDEEFVNRIEEFYAGRFD